MCSWCYGFSNELDTIIKNNPQFELKLIMGGLRPHNTEKIKDMSDFLKQHWMEVNKRSHQPFSYEILNHPTMVYDTEPASRAVVVARTMQPTLEYDFFKAVQTAFYKNGKDTNLVETYLPIAESLNLDIEQFKTLFNSEDIKFNTTADFQLAANIGIRGFPSLVLKRGTEFTQLSNGYNEAENIQQIIDKVL